MWRPFPGYPVLCFARLRPFPLRDAAGGEQGKKGRRANLPPIPAPLISCSPVSSTRDDDPMGRSRVLPQRCGAVPPREEQRKVPILDMFFLYLLIMSVISGDFLCSRLVPFHRDAEILRSVARAGSMKDLGL
jgi:hypothetical protein